MLLATMARLLVYNATLIDLLFVVGIHYAQASSSFCAAPTSCRLIPYGLLGGQLEQTHLVAADLRKVVVEIPRNSNERPVMLLTSECLQNIRPYTYLHQGKMRVGMNLASEVVEVRNNSKTCKAVAGAWHLVSGEGFNNHNLYENMVLCIMPLHLLSRVTCTSQQLRVTHYGNTNPSLPFKPLYEAIADYQPWLGLLAGLSEYNYSCLEFDRLLILKSYWAFNLPLPVNHHNYIYSFARTVLASTGLSAVKPERCSIKLLYATRQGRSRGVANEHALLKALNQTFDNVVVEEIGRFNISEQIALVRSADVLLAPHGAALCHALWMVPGSVVIELFPFESAHTMYRNLAVLSGKTYLSWQTKKFDDVLIQKGTVHRGHSYVVNITELTRVLQTAKMIVANNVDDRWIRSDGTLYEYRLFEPENLRQHVCNRSV